MIDGIPVSVSVIGGVVAGGGALVAVSTFFYQLGHSKNGYVKRTDCHRHVDELSGRVRTIETKLDTVSEDVHYIRGSLDGRKGG